jgi:RNA polymerase sigma factor for flagellar operon FliA
MLERHTCEATLLAHLNWLRQTMAAVCRRHAMGHADTEDFVSWATLRLVENDYAILRQFRGECAVRTYLVVVVAMLHREYRTRSWGRWRPSAAARRAGAVALRLEALVYRDGHTLREAALILRTAGETDLSARELAALFATLPRRTRGRLIELVDAVATEIPDARAGTSAEAHVLVEQMRRERRAFEAALDDALAALPHEDARLVRMRFWDGMTVADIARALQVPQKPLYRRMERALALLRRSLERTGLSWREVRALLEHAA